MNMYNLNQIPSEAQIRKYLRKIIFGKKVFCPDCKSKNIFKSETRYFCPKCRKHFSLLSDTWLASMKLPLPTFWLILWCWTTQVPIKQAVALCQRSEDAIRHWYELFRSHLPQDTFILEKVVQLDEAYGHGWSLIMAKQPGTRKLAYHFLKENDVQRQHAAYFLQNYVKPKSKLYTDGAGIYRGIDRWWPVKHKKDIHRKWEFELTSEIEGTFGNLRTFIRRMYHHATPDKLPGIVGEFCFRFFHPEIFNNPHQYLSLAIRSVPFD